VIDVFAILGDLARRTGAEARALSVIELNRSAPRRNVVALLAFRQGSPDPIAFLKASADPDRAAALCREFDNLSRLVRGGDPAFRATIPEPLYCERLGELTVLAESARSGTRMKDFPPDEYFGSRRFREHYRRCADWLVAFHRAAGGRDDAPPAAPAADVAARYRATHRVSRAAGALLDEAVAALADRPLAGVPMHGDYCAANVLVPASGDPVVIDWEHSPEPGWPLADLLHFTASTWCVPYRKGREALEANYRRLFFEPHGYSDLIRDAVARQVAEPGLWLPLATLSWAAFANRKHDDLAAGGRSPSSHLPLILVADGACLNLEILATLPCFLGTFSKDGFRGQE
jgi:hypothetical protein